MRLAQGTRLGHCEVISPLGKGGTGEVYLAQDVRLGRRVALKVVPAAFADDPDSLARFIREAKAASALNLPNIITIHDIGDAAGRLRVRGRQDAPRRRPKRSASRELA